MKEMFHDFEPAEKSDWKRKIEKDLHLEDADQLLEPTLDSGIVQSVYCDFSDPVTPDWLKKFRNCQVNSAQEWQGARYWLNIERLTGEDATSLNKLGLTALNGGADGLEFDTSLSQWGEVLEGISIPDCHLALRGSLEQAIDFKQHLSREQTFQGYLVIDDLINQSGEALKGLAISSSHQGSFRVLTLGEPLLQEDSLLSLAGLLQTAIELINKLLDCGLSLSQIAAQIQFELNLGDQYLWEICRLRALRILFYQIVQQYGRSEFQAPDLMIKATTGNRQEENKDPNHQMLRNTSQAMAAVLGGCNVLNTLPHDGGYQDSSSLARRVARNVSLIIREESYLHQVADPVAGSYYMESLTTKIMKVTWEKLQGLISGKHKSNNEN